MLSHFLDRYEQNIFDVKKEAGGGRFRSEHSSTQWNGLDDDPLVEVAMGVEFLEHVFVEFLPSPETKHLVCVDTDWVGAARR